MKRILMWSGPRNISTAMMRSWGNRADTVVCDEPLYAHYLQETGFNHPGAEAVLAHHETDWRKVVETLRSPLPDGKTIQYEKQMAHHLLPEIDLEWLNDGFNCLLIRDPGAALVSLSKFLPTPTIEETGLPQQWKICEYLRSQTGSDPPIIDAADVLQSPTRTLKQLCARLGVSYDDRMLWWPPGPRATDGVWAEHWYANVYQTTGFVQPEPSSVSVPLRLEPLLTACNAIYDLLWRRRLRVNGD